MVASTHASVSIFRIMGLKAGVRALPDFSRSRLRCSSVVKSRTIDPILLQDERDIAVLALQQLQQEVLHFHVIVGTGQTEPGRGFQSTTGGMVQLSNQGFQVQAHRRRSVLLMSTAYRGDLLRFNALRKMPRPDRARNRGS